MKAIILAGGRGERLRPLTDRTPKPLISIKGKPIMQRCIENLEVHGIKDIILSVGYMADKIKDYFGNGGKHGVRIEYNIEENPLGTGGAIKDIVKKFKIEEDFISLWGDNIANFDISGLLETHGANKGLVTMALTKRKDVENFGVVKLSGEKIEGFVEKPKREEAPSNLINAGAFVANPKILEMLPEGKSSIERDCFEILAGQGKIYLFKHEGYWYPTDTIEKCKYAEENLVD